MLASTFRALWWMEDRGQGCSFRHYECQRLSSSASQPRSQLRGQHQTRCPSEVAQEVCASIACSHKWATQKGSPCKRGRAKHSETVDLLRLGQTMCTVLVSRNMDNYAQCLYTALEPHWFRTQHGWRKQPPSLRSSSPSKSPHEKNGNTLESRRQLLLLMLWK